jgi:two-component system, sensor histidine kinase and response regulator
MDGFASNPLKRNEQFEVVEDSVPQPSTPPSKEAPDRTAGTCFDMAAALERTAGDHELLRELAAVFCHECPSMMAGVRSALDQTDAPKVMAAAHALKGAAGAFGPSVAYEAAYELEIMGRKGQLAGGEAVYDKLHAEVERLAQALEKLARGGT